MPANIVQAASKPLHRKADHPISITRALLESQFPQPTYKYWNDLHPVVTTKQNFDSLGFPQDHPGRRKTDTYYVDREHVLRTHTSAHQVDIFRKRDSKGFLISADVYRRDAIDRSHYPVFHQMEGARTWDKSDFEDGDIAKGVWADFEKLPKHDMKVEDPNPPFHAERNPIQEGKYTPAEVEAIAAHLKRSVELAIAEIFSRARIARGVEDKSEPLRVRWIEAYFPFTSPSWELEILWQGEWLEVLGCGIVQQDIYVRAGLGPQYGWAFGIGLERIAMLLFDIPDIRLFWSEDKRFVEQFKGVTDDLSRLKRFVPFSKHPACYKDVAFWLPTSTSSIGEAPTFHENDVMEIVRGIGGDNVEDVKLVDEFTHPKTKKQSVCYRINYRSLERTLTNEEANQYHKAVQDALVAQLGVELR